MNDDEQPSAEELERRRRWFDEYVRQLEHESVVLPKAEGTRYACPCCRCLTLEERGGYDLCPVCFWEDDGQDDQDAHRVRGGPNGRLSLTQARQNYAAFGACDERCQQHVRPPLPAERTRGG